MGESGRRFTKDHYSAEVVAEKYSLLLEAWRRGADDDIPTRGEDSSRKGFDNAAAMRGILSRLQDLPEPLPPAPPLSELLADTASKALEKLRRLKGGGDGPGQKP